MDQVLSIVFGLAVLALLIFAPFIKRSLNSKASAYGARKGQEYAAKRLVVVLEQFGTTLVINSVDSELNQIIDSVADRKKVFSINPSGGWQIKFMEKDDLQIELVAKSMATRELRVSSFKDFLGFPQGYNEWDKFRKLVEEELTKRNISFQNGRAEYQRTTPIDEKNYQWKLVEQN